MKSYMTKPVASEADARVFIEALHDDGKLYHFDNSPETVVCCASGAPTFTAEECVALRLRVAELFVLPGFDPFEFALELL